MQQTAANRPRYQPGQRLIKFFAGMFKQDQPSAAPSMEQEQADQAGPIEASAPAAQESSAAPLNVVKQPISQKQPRAKSSAGIAKKRARKRAKQQRQQQRQRRGAA